MVKTKKSEFFLEHLNKNYSVSEARKVDCDEVGLAQISQHDRSAFAFKEKGKKRIFEIVIVIHD